MALTDGSGNMVMPVGPMNGYGGCSGMFGDGAFWLIVLFLFAMMGNGFGGYGGNAGQAMPYIMNQDTGAALQRGFDQQATIGGINAVQNGINTLAQGQCAGFANTNQNTMNGFFNAEIAANARHSAIDGRLDSIAMSQMQGAYENRAAIADVKYAIATDGAQTRSNDDANKQAIMDKLCQLELDGVKQRYEAQILTMQQGYDTRIAGMQAEINALNDKLNSADRRVAISEEVDALYNRLSNCPVPTTPVYGRTPIFTCQGQNPPCPNNGFGNTFVA